MSEGNERKREGGYSFDDEVVHVSHSDLSPGYLGTAWRRFRSFPRNLKQFVETRDVASMPKTDDGGFDPVVSSPAKPLQSDPVLHTCMEGKNLQIFMAQIIIDEEKKKITSPLILFHQKEQTPLN